MKRVHIVGRKNHGKTALIAELLPVLKRRGLSVGAVKHCGHAYELDAPGTDSHRLRTAGADAVGVITPELVAAYRPCQSVENAYDLLTPWLRECDLLIIEGHLEGPGPKVEVWRGGLGEPPLADSRRDIAGVITDDSLDERHAVWPRQDLDRAADGILSVAGLD